MKSKQFDRSICEFLAPTMGELGFKYERLTFFRELPNSVIHLMGLEFDPYSSDTFRIMCGINTRKIESEAALHPQYMGYGGGQHLTPKGWDCNSGHWPCKDEQEAQSSLNEIAQLVPQLVEPWFQNSPTLSSVAELMDTEHPRQGIDKAKLFLLDGNLQQAESVLQEFIQMLANPNPWDDPNELDKERLKAEALLREIARTV